MVDRGANGGILGSDAKVIFQHQREVDITGIDNHEINALKIVDASATAMTDKGPVILIMKQYAYHGTGRTIHSSGQIEWYKNVVDERSMVVGGKQCIRTLDGYIIPIDIISGLPYVKMQPNTDTEWDHLPHVILTSGDTWDPKVLDNMLSDKEDWVNTLKDLDEGIIKTPFDQYGNYKGREPTPMITVEPSLDDPIEVGFHRVSEPEFRRAFHEASNINQPYGPTVASAEVKTKPVDYSKYRHFFLNVGTDKIKKTFERTTQFAVSTMSGHNILQTHKSPFPAHNVIRRNEPVATDTVYAEVAAIGTNGQTMAQIFVGRKSLVVSIYGMGTTKEFVNTLEDEIRRHGAMDKLITNSAQVEISRRTMDLLRALCIDDWQSEAHYQHQNFAEHRWRHVQRNVKWVMNWRDVAPEAWLLCMIWVADVMNHTAEKSLGWRPPLEVLSGRTIDISILLRFVFWDVVYCPRYKDAQYGGNVGSQKSSEIRGRFVGFSWSVGHSITFKILTDDSKRIISRSQLRLAKDGENNLKLDRQAGAVPQRDYFKSKRDMQGDKVVLPTLDLRENPFVETVDEDEASADEKKEGEQLDEPETPMDGPSLRDTPIVETIDEDEENLADHLKEPVREEGEPIRFTEPLKTDNPTAGCLPPEQLIDRTFLMPPQKDGTRVRAKIIKMVDEYKQGMEDDKERIRFKCLVNDEQEEIVAYNDIVDFIEQDQTWDGIWKFREIQSHAGPFKPSDKEYRGSRYNLLIEWESGEITWEPLTTADKTGVYDTDPVTVAIYAFKNQLLDTPGWKLPGMKKRAKTQQRIMRLANQAKLHSFRTKPIYMYGFQVPRNWEQAVELDKENGNTKWQDCTALEMAQIDEYEAFQDKGKGFKPGPDWKKINVHLVYAVKHDGRHKARLVAGGHLTDTPVDSVYSSVVSLRGIRMLAFIAEHNDLELWATDIGNAYLESYTKEKVFVIAGAEFGERAGHTLLIVKALYGLKSSGLRWSQRFADVLRDMGFFQSRAERDIWMKDCGDHYEYIAVYVDDLLIASKDPAAIIKVLREKYDFKLKGTGPIEFHLGCDFFRDAENNLCYAPRKYILKMLDNYERIFGVKPKQFASPLVKGDHPETDDSPLLEIEGIKIYQSLIGGLQWVIQIGRFDVSTAVMTMSRFRAAPRQGHLERVKRIHGYLSKMRFGVIRIRTEEPDFSAIPEKKYEWEYTCYGNGKEEIPSDAPRPLGKRVVTSSYVDANLYHDLVSGKAVTGILHFFNKTPIDWFSKLQSTVETATFGSEYVAARTCTEQVIDLRLTLRYLGVPIAGSSWMFGDNETVVNTASMPHSRLHKRHNALSYHKTRASIAAGVVRFHHIRGAVNPADILSKHWDSPSVWECLKPLMFWNGDTGDLLKEGEKDAKKVGDS